MIRNRPPNLPLALDHAAAGYGVFLLSPLTKRPVEKKVGDALCGFHLRTTDADQIGARLRANPQALVGIATDSFFVVDVDHQFDGTIEGLVAVLDRLGLGWIVRHAHLIVITPGGGAHLYFARTPGVAIGTRGSDIAPGIDTRGHTAEGRPTGYITAPGNMRPDGLCYRIIHGALDEIGTAPRGLLYLASFNRRERAEVAATPELRKAISDSAPDCWRALYDEHAKAAMMARLASRPPLRADDDGPMRMQALADMQDRAARLASKIDGRKSEAYKAAAAVGKYVAAGMLSADEVIAALMDAWADCGGLKKHGPKYGLDQIRNGLQISRNDPLPPLANQYRNRIAAAAMRAPLATHTMRPE